MSVRVLETLRIRPFVFCRHALSALGRLKHFLLLFRRVVLLALSRDPLVPNRTAVEPLSLPPSPLPQRSAVSSREGDAAAERVDAPVPNGVLPVRGLAHLAAPLCYLHEHPAAIYRLFRSLYARYVHRDAGFLLLNEAQLIWTPLISKGFGASFSASCLWVAKAQPCLTWSKRMKHYFRYGITFVTSSG